MKKHTKKYTTYAINELHADIKAKVLDKNRDINVDDTYSSNDIIEDFKLKMFELGFYDTEVFYSGFWSQGDGASFTASVDVVKWLDCHKAIKKNNIALYRDLQEGDYTTVITQSGHYYHDMSMSIDSEYYNNDDKLGKQFNAVEDMILEDARQEARKLYKELMERYEYMTSDEAVTDTIIANDCQFLKDGSISIQI